MSKGIKMKQLLELLRLHCELKFSQRDIAKMVNISKTTVHNYIELFEASGLIWPLPEEYLDEIYKFIRFESRVTKANA
jgi:DNA-binding MarR family transcriptional regulator